MIKPDAFSLGSRATLDAVVAKVRSYFRNQPDVVQEWLDFAAAAPMSDCVQEYCTVHPLDIPFKVTFYFAFINC
jgi:hypothetical protein